MEFNELKEIENTIKSIFDEMKEIYKRSIRVEYILGALARSEEQSNDFFVLQPLHIHEMTGSLELVCDYQGDITTRMDKVISDFENLYNFTE